MFTGERLETSIDGRVAIEHLHRYGIAGNYVRDKIVLDIACGEGYGTNLLSKKAKTVYGVDIDEGAVSRAKTKYTSKNINFLVGSTSKIPLEDNSVDTVVSFETIEHHDEHQQMMSEIKRVLKTDGIMIISSPDKLYYSDKRNYSNEFHVKELYKDEFDQLLKDNFKHVHLLSQTHINGVSVILNEINHQQLEQFTGNFKNVIQEEKNPMFLIAIASEKSIENPAVSIFNGEQINAAALAREIEKVRKSITFKIGNIVLYPFKLVKRLFWK